MTGIQDLRYLKFKIAYESCPFDLTLSQVPHCGTPVTEVLFSFN